MTRPTKPTSNSTEPQATPHPGLLELVRLLARHALELYGELGAILSLCGEGANADARAFGAGVGQVTMVAGARNSRFLRLVEDVVPRLVA